MLDKLGQSDVVKEMKSLSPWNFVKGSLPYVIIGCASILEQRSFLSMSDKLSNPVTKIFSTLQWILLEAADDPVCTDDASKNDHQLDFYTVELFVHMLIPCVQNLHESDLTFSLSPGLHIWSPIWNHLAPIGTILALPVVKFKKAIPKPINSISPMRSSREDLLESDNFAGVASYFDIAVLKSLMVEHWSNSGYRWCLVYLEKLLRFTLINGIDVEDEDRIDVLKLQKKILPRRNYLGNSSPLVESYQHSPKSQQSIKASSPSPTPLSPTLHSSIAHSVPTTLSTYVTDFGKIRISFVVKVLQKFCKRPILATFSSSLVCILGEIIELGLGEKRIQDISDEFESVLFCFVNIVISVGCSNGCKGSRGTIGEYLRLIYQVYFKKLIDINKQRVEDWFKSYVLVETKETVISFLHSFLGYCSFKPARRESVHSLGISEEQPVKVFENQSSFDNDNSSQHAEMMFLYVQTKGTNEKLLLNWIGEDVFKRFAKDMYLAEEVYTVSVLIVLIYLFF